MTGTLVNVTAIVAGTGLGLALGARFRHPVRQTVTDVLGVFVIVLGLSDALTAFGPEMTLAFGRYAALLVLGALLLGAIIGETIDIEGRLEQFGRWLRRRTIGPSDDHPDTIGEGRDAPFVEGFVVTSLIVCVGPLAILGALQDGLTDAFPLLAVKSMLDGTVAIAFASSMGVGVAFAAIPLLVWQGGLTLAASAIGGLITAPMVAALTAVGGVLVIGIGLRLLEIRTLRVANLLPALILAPLAAALWAS